MSTLDIQCFSRRLGPLPLTDDNCCSDCCFVANEWRTHLREPRLGDAGLPPRDLSAEGARRNTGGDTVSFPGGPGSGAALGGKEESGRCGRTWALEGPQAASETDLAISGRDRAPAREG